MNIVQFAELETGIVFALKVVHASDKPGSLPAEVALQVVADTDDFSAYTRPS